MEISPLYCKVIITLGFGGDVLPQLVGSQTGPHRVVATTRHPVTTFATFAARHQLIRWQVGYGIREGAQEAVQEMTYSSREGRQLHTLQKKEDTQLSKLFQWLRKDTWNVTNLEVRLEDMFCTPGDKLANSYSLRSGKFKY